MQIEMKAYQCKVSIKGSKPLVWWRVLLPAGVSFSMLSLLLEELTGMELGDSFEFEIHRDSRVWEFTEALPLRVEYYYSAYSAAHTPLSTLFEKGRPLYVKGIGATLKIDVEKVDDAYPLRFPLLVKMRADMDGQQLFWRLKSRFSLCEDVGPALCRSELLHAERDGVLALHCVDPTLIRGSTYHPSGNAILAETISLVKETVTGKSTSVWGMHHLLLSYSIDDLQDLARYYGIQDAEQMGQNTLVEKMYSLLLQPDAIRKAFLLLTDEEIQAFEAAAAEKSPHRLTAEETGLFDKLSVAGYAFIDADQTTVDIPGELLPLYRLMNTPHFINQRRQINWIVRCMNSIVPPYYALMPLQKFCRLCRRTNNPQILPEDVQTLLGEIPAGFTECVVVGDEICSKELAEKREIRNHVLSVHGNKPWHIMREGEISDLLTYGYPPRDPSYRSLKAYLHKSFRLDSRQVEDITKRIHRLSALCYEMQDLFDVLDTYHLKLRQRQIEELSAIFQDVMNNTPTYYNRGYTPAQMGEMRNNLR